MSGRPCPQDAKSRRCYGPGAAVTTIWQREYQLVAKLEFYFDCSSPWTYLAFSQIELVANRAEAEIDWRPILVGGVFNTVNQSVYEQRANPVPAKAEYHIKDLMDWAHHYDLTINWPSVFPVKSVDAMRGAIVANVQDKLPAYAQGCFEAYWKCSII